MKRVIMALVATALVVGCGGSTANAPASSPTPPLPVVKYNNNLPGQSAAAPVDLIQSIIVFAPGAASTVHKHPTIFLATVLQGQITLHTPSGDKVSMAGEVIHEPLNQPVQAFNTGSVDAMTVVAYPVPHGAKATLPVAGSPAPATANKTLYTFTFDSPSISGPYSVVQQELDFAPGSQTPRHKVGGPGVITVLQGEITLIRDGMETTYKAGDSFTETPGQTLQAFNRGSTDLIVAASYLLPDGTQLTTTA